MKVISKIFLTFLLTYTSFINPILAQNFVIEGGGTHGFITNNVTETSPVNIVPTTGFFNLNNNIGGVETSFTMQPGYYIGILGARSISDNVKMEVGLRFTHYRFDVNSQVKNIDGLQNNIQGGLTSILFNGNNFGSMLIGVERDPDGNFIIDETIWNNQTNLIATPSISGSVSYLELPLNVYYSLGNRMDVFSGISIGTILGSNRTMEYTIFNNFVEMEDTSGDTYNSLQLSTNMGLEYRLRSNISIQLNYKYYFTRLQEPNPEVNQIEASKEHIHALSLGVRYRIDIY